MVTDKKTISRTLWLSDKTSHPIEVSTRIETFINNFRQHKYISIFKDIKEEYCNLSTIDLNNMLDCITKNNIHTAFPREIKTYVLILQVLSKRFRINNRGTKIFDTQLIKEISKILGIPIDKQIVLTDIVMQDMIISNNPANLIT